MFMADPKRKAATIIVNGLGAAPEAAPAKDGVEQDSSPALEAAASKLLSAIKADSAKSVAAAIKELLDCCDDSDLDDADEPSMAAEVAAAE